MPKKQNQSSNEYWAKRAELRETQSMNITAETLERMKDEYELITERIQQQVNKLYMKYANDNNLSITDAKIRLTAKEKEDLLISLTDYANMSKSGLEEHQELLDRISARVRITRLDAITEQIDMLQDLLYENLDEIVNKGFDEVYTQAYYKKIYDIQSRGGVGKPFQLIDTRMQNIVTQYVDGFTAKDFSKNIWKNTARLSNEWKKTIEVGLVNGSSGYDLTKQISERMGVSYRAAKGMVRTETNNIHTQAHLHAMNEQEAKKYQFISTLDSVTTDICIKLDLTEHLVSEAETGVNCPPMHYNCRSTILELLPEWLRKHQEGGTRTARDSSGITYKVPSDMNYETWYNKHVQGSDIDIAYKDAVIAEPKITKDLQEIANNTKTTLAGLDFRLKTKESLERKVSDDISVYKGKFTQREVLNKISDINRYTAIFNPNTFEENYMKFTSELNLKGHRLVNVKNTWENPMIPYKGINCKVISPGGQKYELQFHTKESFDLKNGEMHRLYEIFRDASKTEYERGKANKRMFELSANLVKPKDIDKIR